MMLFRRRVLWVAIAVFLFMAGLIVWIMNLPEAKSAAIQTVSYAQGTDMNTVEKFQMAQQQLRALVKAQLNNVAYDGNTDEELREMAQRQLLGLCKREELELVLEGMLELRGWQEVMVIVSEDCVNVLIAAETITQQESSVILEMVCRETGVTAGNVKIIPIN